jgi:hypothetical protein
MSHDPHRAHRDSGLSSRHHAAPTAQSVTKIIRVMAYERAVLGLCADEGEGVGPDWPTEMHCLRGGAAPLSSIRAGEEASSRRG